MAIFVGNQADKHKVDTEHLVLASVKFHQNQFSCLKLRKVIIPFMDNTRISERTFFVPLGFGGYLLTIAIDASGNNLVNTKVIKLFSAF